MKRIIFTVVEKGEVNPFNLSFVGVSGLPLHCYKIGTRQFLVLCDGEPIGIAGKVTTFKSAEEEEVRLAQRGF